MELSQPFIEAGRRIPVSTNNQKSGKNIGQNRLFAYMRDMRLQLLISPAEAAKILGVNQRTVYQAIYHKKLKACKIAGSWWVPYKDLTHATNTPTPQEGINE